MRGTICSTNVSAERFGQAAWIWDILHQRGVIAFDGIKFRPGYPVLPWIGVMAVGIAWVWWLIGDADRRRRFLVRLALALAAAFVVVRAVNIYGDPLLVKSSAWVSIANDWPKSRDE